MTKRSQTYVIRKMIKRPNDVDCPHWVWSGICPGTDSDLNGLNPEPRLAQPRFRRQSTSFWPLGPNDRVLSKVR